MISLRQALRPLAARTFGLHLQAEWLAVEMRERIVRDDGYSLKLIEDTGWWQPNGLANEGQTSMLDVWLRAQTNPSKYLALLNMVGGSVPTKTTTMSTMTEATTPGTNGYARQQVLTSDWGTAALDSGDEQETMSAAKTFGNFTGSVSISHVAGVTVSTGTGGLFLFFLPTAYYSANAAARTFVAGENYQVTIRDKQI